MPKGYCLFPQDLKVDEFLDDGQTSNLQRCPYRTRWKPYITKEGNKCCQRAYVPKLLRSADDPRVPETHVNFPDMPNPIVPVQLQKQPNPRGCASLDETSCRKNKRCRYLSEDVEPGLRPGQCRPRTWMPNRNCPEGSLCQPGGCTPKFVTRFNQAIPRVCSDNHRCVLPDSVAWKRSGCGRGSGDDLKNEYDGDDLKHNDDELPAYESDSEDLPGSSMIDFPHVIDGESSEDELPPYESDWDQEDEEDEKHEFEEVYLTPLPAPAPAPPLPAPAPPLPDLPPPPLSSSSSSSSDEVPLDTLFQELET